MGKGDVVPLRSDHCLGCCDVLVDDARVGVLQAADGGQHEFGLVHYLGNRRELQQCVEAVSVDVGVDHSFNYDLILDAISLLFHFFPELPSPLLDGSQALRCFNGNCFGAFVDFLGLIAVFGLGEWWEQSLLDQLFGGAFE